MIKGKKKHLEIHQVVLKDIGPLRSQLRESKLSIPRKAKTERVKEENRKIGKKIGRLSMETRFWMRSDEAPEDLHKMTETVTEDQSSQRGGGKRYLKPLKGRKQVPCRCKDESTCCLAC